MALTITRQNQNHLLDLALTPTASTGWQHDAIAFGVKAQDGNIRAVGVFQGFEGGDAEFHFAILSGGTMTRGLIEAMILVAFHHRGLGLERLWAHIAADNRAAIRAAVAVGFDFRFRKRGGFPRGQDAIVLSMSRPDPGLAAARSETETDS
jgi:hypothetical protein